MKNRINVILVNYNSLTDTENCIKSLRECNKGIFEVEIIVVDNNSKSTVKKSLRKLCECFAAKLIENDGNYGFAKANNIGFREIQNKVDDDFCDYVWFFNNDTKIETGFFEKLNENLPKDNEVLYFEMRNFSGDFVNDGLNYCSKLTGRYSESFKKNYIQYICGASVFLKLTERVPLWNEDFFLYYEDVDYSLRLIKKGYSFVEVKGLHYLHKVNGSSAFNPKTNKFRIQSQKKFMKENGKCYFVYFLLKILYYMLSLKFADLKDFMDKN